jgi:hypothetical protein
MYTRDAIAKLRLTMPRIMQGDFAFALDGWGLSLAEESLYNLWLA